MSPLLEVLGVSKSFGGLQAVNEVSFAVAPNTISAIIGPNGAGKTTLFNLVTGFMAPSAGRIRLSGVDVTGMPPFRIAACGAVRTFQLVRLFPELSAVENVMIGTHLRTSGGFWSGVLGLPKARGERRSAQSRAAELLSLVGLAAQAHTAAASLAYGQQRLLELARALAAGPRVLMLDEPAAGLDRDETLELCKIIRRVRDAGTAVLFVEHDMSMVMSTAERVMVLDFGRKIAEGTPEDVQRDPKVLDAYLGGFERVG